MKPRPQPGKGTSTRVWLLLAVLALGLGLRVANLIDISDSPFFTRPVVDGRAYDRWALAIIGRAESPQAEAAANGPFYLLFMLVFLSFLEGAKDNRVSFGIAKPSSFSIY